VRPADWYVLVGAVVLIVAYGFWRSRGASSVDKYLLAGKTMPWYAMALSIMATQASAVTFISTPGQSYVDGMRFVQFYFGLPLAMVILSVTAVPIFHRAKVYTAYEYLEQRFDAKTRALVSIIFLLQRGLAMGIALSAPAIVLSMTLGWPDRITIIVIGAVAVFYTSLRGVKAVMWTQFPYVFIMMIGLLVALASALWRLPSGTGLVDAMTIAGAAGKVNPIVFDFSWNDRYNIWSGLFGGMFLALAYFGCDQSQVQRYLTGTSVAQSRLSLLFNGVAKVPMQFFILLIGVVVFAFYTFEKPPVLFRAADLQRIEASGPEYAPIARRYDAAFERRKQAALEIVRARHDGDPGARAGAVADYHRAQQEFDAARGSAVQLARRLSGGEFNDTNYVFLSFVLRYLPAGVVGLMMVMIFGAAMTSISSEMNALATVSVIDLYGRHVRKDASDDHYLAVAKIATLFWGTYAVVSGVLARNLGSLVEAVNILGSLFYGGLLGVFVLAFFFKRVGGSAAFAGVIAGETAIFAAAFLTDISFLWYNVIGCLVVVATALTLSIVAGSQPDNPASPRPA
jgi:Na+/proline symporter